MAKSKFSVPVPRSRGLGDPEKFSLDTARALASGGGSSGNGDGLDSNIRDLIIHAAICRIAYKDDSNHEFYTRYDEENQVVDCDIPTELLDYLMRVEVGPNLTRYFSWLTNSIHNLRRDSMQFTIGADPAILIGQQGIGLTVAYDCVIERVDLLTIPAGDIEIELSVMPVEDWPGDSSHVIGTVGVVGSNRAVDVDISGWETELCRGECIVYRVIDTGTAGVQQATVSLYVLRDSTYELGQT